MAIGVRNLMTPRSLATREFRPVARSRSDKPATEKLPPVANRKVRTLTEVAKILGVSQPAVSQWKKAGCSELQKPPYDPQVVNDWRQANLPVAQNDSAVGKNAADAGGKPKRDDGTEIDPLSGERVKTPRRRKLEAEATRVEIDVKIRERQLQILREDWQPTELVRQVHIERMAAMRQGWDNFPESAAFDLCALCDELDYNDAVELLRSKRDEVLEMFSRPDFASAVKERVRVEQRQAQASSLRSRK